MVWIKKIFLISIMFIISFITYYVKAVQNNNDEKVYCDATVSDDFVDDVVCVVMTRSETMKFKEYSIEDFSTFLTDDLSIKNVIELTKDSTSTLKEQLKEGCDIDEGLVNAKKYRRIFSLQLKHPGKDNVLKAIKQLEVDFRFYYVGVDYIDRYELFDFESEEITYNMSQEENFNLANIQEAWNISTGSSNTLVGILDTGIDSTHPDLENNVNDNLSRDFTNTTLTDTHGHGTGTAGVIGANGGIMGVCPNITLVSLKIMVDSNNDLESMPSRLVSATSYASSIGIKILNLSGGRVDGSYRIIEKQAIDNYNGLLILAAGNYPYDIDDTTEFYPYKRNYPACYDCTNILVASGLSGVGSIPINDMGWDNYGCAYGIESVDIYAPASEVYTTSVNGGYARSTGTSLACAFTTGVAALLLSEYTTLNTLNIKGIIMSSVTKVSNFSSNCLTSGKLNAGKALYLDVFAGEGTQNNPYLVSSISDFYCLDVFNTTGLYFEQSHNIDFLGKMHNQHFSTFNGNYNGNNKTISNIIYIMPINSPHSVFGGLFGNNYGIIQNLVLNYCVFELSSQNLNHIYVGGFVGSNQGIIKNVAFRNSSIISSSEFLISGGIAGANVSYVNGISVDDCEVLNMINHGYGHMGGIIGENENGTIKYCVINNSSLYYYQQGLIDYGIGGIVGFNKDEVVNCEIGSGVEVIYGGSATTTSIKPRMGVAIGLNWYYGLNHNSIIAHGSLIPGALNPLYNQLDYFGAYYNGKVGADFS